jgi:mannose-6-phosphate isomerase
LLGDVSLESPHGQFPLLIKFLDAKEDLSIQVHPDRKYAAAHPDAFLKSEAWFIVQSDPGAFLYKGLKPGTTKEQFRQGIDQGHCERLLNSIPVKPGDCFYLPSGTVHAVGAGILAAEVQTPSDTTFRVYDFNRIDPSTGTTRLLHVEQAMDCIHFGEEPPESSAARTRIALCNSPSPGTPGEGRGEGLPANQMANALQNQPSPYPSPGVPGEGTKARPLVQCEYFEMDEIRAPEKTRRPLPTGRPYIWIILDGPISVKVDNLHESADFHRGDTVLFPAAMSNPVLSTAGNSRWLEIKFPQ